MTEVMKRCPAAQDRGGYTLGKGKAGSSSFFAEGTATWHGGRTDVMSTRPGRTAANEALVTPVSAAASGTGVSASPVTSGRGHGLE
jgi:hypothetical protein